MNTPGKIRMRKNHLLGVIGQPAKNALVIRNVVNDVCDHLQEDFLTKEAEIADAYAKACKELGEKPKHLPEKQEDKPTKTK